MTLLSADSFNRANNAATLGSTDGAGTLDPLAWPAQTGTWGIFSNEAYLASNTTRAVNAPDFGAADVDISVVLVGVSNNGLAFRYADPNNFWYLWYSGSGNIQLVRRDTANGSTTIATVPGPNAGDTIRVVANGSAIDCYVNASLVISTTDAFHTANTKHGLYGDGFGGTFNDFSISDIAAAAVSANAGAATGAGTAYNPAASAAVPIVTIRLDASPTFPEPSAGAVGVSTGEPDEAYTIRVVNMVGDLITELPLAQPGDIIETLNSHDQFDIAFPKGAYTQDDVAILGTPASPHEIQILLGDKVLAWGPAITPDGGSGAGPVKLTGAGGSGAGPVKLTGAGVDWYFTKRNLDVEPVNLLPNPGFEDNLDFWNVQGGGVTATIETDLVLEGARAVRLEGPANSLGIISDPFLHTTKNNPEVLTFTFSFVIEEYLGPALFRAGVVLEASRPGVGGDVVGGVNAKRTALYRIDGTTPRGVENRVALQLQMPARTTWAIRVNLFGVHGSIVWDAGNVIVEKAFSTNGVTGTGAIAPLSDVSRIVRMLATVALTQRNNKTGLHLGLETPTIGVKLARLYPAADHVAFDQAFAEFIDRDDCFDYAIRYTRTTRTLVLYPMSSGGRGVDRSADITLTYGQAPVTGYTPTIDGAGTITQATVLGDGTANVREEAWATDASAIGGTVLQGIVNAPANARRDSLAPMARELVHQRGAAPKVLEITIDRTPVIIDGDPVVLQDLLGVGDTVGVAITDGWWTFDGAWRIVQRVRHCRARTMSYTLNKVIA